MKQLKKCIGLMSSLIKKLKQQSSTACSNKVTQFKEGGKKQSPCVYVAALSSCYRRLGFDASFDMKQLEKCAGVMSWFGKERKMYKRKTEDVYYIYGNCGYGWDIECCCEDWLDAKAQLKCYRENVNYPVKIVKKRERIQA